MSDPRIQFLIDNLQESLDVEVKNWLGGLGSGEEKSKLAKAIIALANNGGGYIFIGFEDKGPGHPEIQPQADEAEGFTQDAIAAVINSYITPAFQCSLGWYQRDGSQLKHPVITVPGDHRTPVWAIRSSPDGGEATERLQNNVVYVRRPGGQSEPPRSQDDWEKLLERLVKARQGDLLDAIRDILNPRNTLTAPASTLVDWRDECLEAWKARISGLKPDDGRRLESGYWSFAFEVHLDKPPSLKELNDALKEGLSRLSGWPPFTYLHQAPMRPVAKGDVIEAWLADSHDPNDFVEYDRHSDFWRVSRSGKGFILRPMQEDEPGFLSNRFPRPEGKFFDWILPTYRMVELLKVVEAFGLKFSDENAQYDVLLRYCGTKDRTLQQHKWEYALRDGARCHSEMLESRLSGIISELGTNIEERVFVLLTPIFEQFEFTKLPKVLVDNVAKEALTYR
jgi:hypothetical protein